MKLLVDVGNTRAKWAVLERGELSRGSAIVHRPQGGEWMQGLDAAGGPFEAILVANVAGPSIGHALGEWALARHGLRPEFVQASRAAAGSRLRAGLRTPLGRPRWLHRMTLQPFSMR